MLNLLNCMIYLILIGIVAFVLGRIIPKDRLLWDRFPWRSFEFENNGKLYEKLKIKSWQNRVPDMSKLFYKIMPKKALPKKLDTDTLTIMLRETCMAELIHVLLAVLSLGCIFIWQDIGGIIIAVVTFIGNFVFVIIQRYNRPRLARLFNRTEKQAARRQTS